MVALGAIAGGAGGIGSLINSAVQAHKNRAFIKHMYQNRYQFTMSDMRKAGLNPMLAANLGAAVPPSGGQAAQPDLGGFLRGITEDREEKSREITRGRGKTDADIAKQQLRITSANARIAERDADLATSAYGIRAARAKQAPEGMVGRGLFGLETLGHYLGRFTKGMGERVHEGPSAPGRTIRIHKFDKRKK